jgi:hypothetical protein
MIKIHPDHVLTVLRVNGAPPEECLRGVLDRVNKSIYDAVVSVLCEAKIEKFQGERDGHRIDYWRELEARVKPALAANKRLNRFLTANGGTAKVLDDTIRFISALDSYIDQPGPHRRKKEGRHVQPWISEARRKLKRLGVSVGLAEELLLATGIRRPRSNES